jgi:hypothetical protein
MGASEERLGGHLRRGTPEPPVTQHGVDAVASGRERRPHALELLDLAQLVHPGTVVTPEEAPVAG